jgi:hypothetical protein
MADVLDHHESRNLENARIHLAKWLVLTEEAIHMLFQLEKTLESGLHGEERGKVGKMFMLVARMVSMSAASRKLVSMGFEDAARPVVRSLLETIDVAIAFYGNDAFCDKTAGPVRAKMMMPRSTPLGETARASEPNWIRMSFRPAPTVKMMP